MPRCLRLIRPFSTWLGVIAVALACAAPGLGKEDPYFAGVAGGGVPFATLSNGNGDGTAEAQVDPTGFFGSGTGGLDFDPSGPRERSGTTFFSGLWFSGANRAGQAGGTFLGLNSDIGAKFTSITQSRAVSAFTLDGIQFTLVQELLPSTAAGTTLRQTYSMKNVSQNGTVDFDLLRHFDGDLTFDNSIDDVAVRTPSGQQLYELDSNEDPAMPTTFVEIDFNGQADLGFRIAEFSFTSDISQQGRGVLNGAITMDGSAGQNSEDADRNDDGITDVPYDVTLTLGRTFRVPMGSTVSLVTNTILGTGSPNDILSAPSNLTATREDGDRALLQWQDNSQSERGFEIQRRAGNGEFVKRGTTDPNVTRFTDRKVRSNTVYTYRVRALRSPAPTEFSNEAVLTEGSSEGQPRFIEPSPRDGTRFRVDPGETVAFTVRAIEPDKGEVVDLFVDGAPPGAGITPKLPTTDNPVSATFSWTPTESDKGIYDLVFTARTGILTGLPSTQVHYRILVGRVGVCVNGDVGESKALRVDGLAGYPRGGRKFIGQLTMKLKREKQVFKATEITRLQLLGKTVTMEGFGTVNGRGAHRFVLQGEDNGPTPRDRVLIVTVDGVPWPSGTLRSGKGVVQHLP